MPSAKRSFDYNLLAGNPVTTALRNPGAGENGKVPAWNNGTKKWEPVVAGGGVGSDVFIPEAYDASVTNLPPTTYDGAAPTAGCRWHVTVQSAADVNGDIAIPEGALIEYIPGYVAGDFANYKIIQA
jgi:hypothetical protein